MKRTNEPPFVNWWCWLKHQLSSSSHHHKYFLKWPKQQTPPRGPLLSQCQTVLCQFYNSETEKHPHADHGWLPAHRLSYWVAISHSDTRASVQVFPRAVSNWNHWCIYSPTQLDSATSPAAMTAPGLAAGDARGTQSPVTAVLPAAPVNMTAAVRTEVEVQKRRQRTVMLSNGRVNWW